MYVWLTNWDMNLPKITRYSDAWTHDSITLDRRFNQLMDRAFVPRRTVWEQITHCAFWFQVSKECVSDIPANLVYASKGQTFVDVSSKETVRNALRKCLEISLKTSPGFVFSLSNEYVSSSKGFLSIFLYSSRHF